MPWGLNIACGDILVSLTGPDCSTIELFTRPSSRSHNFVYRYPQFISAVGKLLFRYRLGSRHLAISSQEPGILGKSQSNDAEPIDCFRRYPIKVVPYFLEFSRFLILVVIRIASFAFVIRKSILQGFQGGFYLSAFNHNLAGRKPKFCLKTNLPSPPIDDLDAAIIPNLRESSVVGNERSADHGESRGSRAHRRYDCPPLGIKERRSDQADSGNNKPGSQPKLPSASHRTQPYVF